MFLPRMPHPALLLLGQIQLMRYALGMRGPSDEHLMKQYAAGNASAFEDLYERYKGPLYRYFQRQVRDTPTVNDLYQGSWEKLIKARTRYNPAAPFRAWLFRIAHNHMVDHFRRQRPSEILNPETMVADTPQPAEAFKASEDHSRFRSALQQLPEEQKNALLLKLEAGLNMEEIGKITGVDKETVKSRIRYATAKLKRTLQS